MPVNPYLDLGFDPGLELGFASRPITHKVIRGELKHYYLLKSGRLAYQKTPLTKHSDKQRLSYQMLVGDRAGELFLDIWPSMPDSSPRLPLVPAFLTLSWISPAQHAKPARAIGLPDVLMVPRKDLTHESLEALEVMAGRLNFKIEHPQHGFEAGAHHAKAISDALNFSGIPNVDWRDGANLQALSKAVARYLAVRPSFFTRLRSLSDASASHRGVPEDFLETVTGIYGISVDELKDYAAPYFRSPNEE